MHTAFSQQKELVALPGAQPDDTHPPPARHTRTTTSPSLPADDNKAHPLFSTPVLPSARVLSPPPPRFARAHAGGWPLLLFLFSIVAAAQVSRPGGGSPAHARTHATQTHTTCTKKLPLAGAPPKERMFAGDLVLIQPAAARRQRPRSKSIPLRVLRHDGSDARAGGPRGWSFARDEGPTGARSTRSSSDSSGVSTAAVEARRSGTPKQRQADTGGKP
ncbi:hypothetical protein Purlil1_4795 [Purpureocillium lilacinum]|uniref:Uncharacterized protein n=1 Tax=Purpureocillium lilacinum TaxID=33203 RepID=A0ABR0C2R0_PURLI|nr:hypothetical protein Purlil1_4795 [Purpureocillium lilacinum]